MYGGDMIIFESAHSDRIKDVIWPKPLKPGDLLGVTAPAGPPDKSCLERGAAFLEDAGFRVLPGHCLDVGQDYLAACDDHRCDDLNEMLRNSEVRGIVFARGGYGAMRIVERVDGRAAAVARKALVGMSDLTALQLSLFRNHRLLTFAGPMVAGQLARGLDDFSRRSFLRALTEPLRGVDLCESIPTALKVVREGTAEGPLLGGCLSLVSALLGTDHLPSFEGAILLMEDVNEPLYRIDRMLTQFRLSGNLDRVVGIVCGHFVGPADEDLGDAVGGLIAEFTEGRGVPIVTGFPHGHRLPNATMPLGAMVMLDTGKPSLLVR